MMGDVNVAENENTAELLIADSRLAFIQGRYDEALKLSKQAIELEGDNADAHQCAGNAYMSKSDLTSAIEHYKKAIESDSENGDRYFNLAYAYATDNQPVEALEMFAKADEKGCSPNVVGQLYKIMAMLCFDMQRYEDAIVNFNKSEKIIGIDMDILQRKALSYSMLGETARGIEVANQMKLLAPTKYIGYRIAFNLLLQDERHEDCAAELDRAERFANPTADYYADWLAYETARFKLDGDKAHLENALEKLAQGLVILKPDVNEVIDSYINAADVYVQLENAGMALKCLNAAENPIQSYNEGFSVVEIEEPSKQPVTRPSAREIDQMVDETRRKFGDRKLDMIGRELARNPNKDISAQEGILTPVTSKSDSSSDEQYVLSRDEQAVYSPEKLDRIYRLYVAAYTIEKDNVHIKMYASKLANSSDEHSKYIGKYALIKVLREENSAQAEDECRLFIKQLRNAMIKDPSDVFALNFRIQCHIDISEYDEAEKLCRLLSDELRTPLLEQIAAAKAGGDT